jgi:IS6 family transposase
MTATSKGVAFLLFYGSSESAACQRVKGKWVYLYRAVDSSGATIDFLLSAKRDAAAAERFLAKALGRQNHSVPRVINTDKHAGYPPIVQLKAAGDLAGTE